MRRYLALTLLLSCTTPALTLQYDRHKAAAEERMRRDEAERRRERQAAEEKMRRERIQCWDGSLVPYGHQCPPTPAEREKATAASRANNQAYERRVVLQKCHEGLGFPGVDFNTRQAAEAPYPSAGPLAAVAVAAHKAGRGDVTQACLALASTTADPLQASLVGDAYRGIEDHSEAIRFYMRSLEVNGVTPACAVGRQGPPSTEAEVAKARAEREAASNSVLAVRLLGRSASPDQLQVAQARLAKVEGELRALECRRKAHYSAAEIASVYAGKPYRYNRQADYRASLGLAESHFALRQFEAAREWALRARSLESRFSSRPDSKSLDEVFRKINASPR